MVNVENHKELLRFLREQHLISDHSKPTLTNLRGGVSNRTVLVQHQKGKGWVVKQALKKLRVKEAWYSRPERIHHEAEGLRQLALLAAPESTPGFIFENRQHHILIMEAIPQPHQNYKELLLRQLPENSHTIGFARLLADIHLNSHQQQARLAELFSDSSFFENLRLEPYYRFSADRLPAAASFLRHLIDQTRLRKQTLVHGDYSPKNVLIYNQKLILLDHEVIHFGDPAFDVGFAMTHYLSKGHFRISCRDAFMDAARLFWKTYWHKTGSAIWADALERHCICHLLGCLLARVVGKSPLEYLDDKQRNIQKHTVLDLIQETIVSMDQLINTFTTGLKQHEHNYRPHSN